MANAQGTDQQRWRATFGQTYPKEVFLAKNNQLPRDLTGVNVLFGIRNKTIEGVGFVTCKFLLEKQSGQADEAEKPSQYEIQHLTFRACHFDRSFLGGVAYLNVRFIDCTFHQCDFGSSRFSDCEFADCRFTECTGWNVLFLRTVIDPRPFMKGLRFPEKNYQGRDPSEIKEGRRKYLETQLAIAGQLLGSLANTTQSDFFDSALFYSKYYAWRVRLRRLVDWQRYQRMHTSPWGIAAAFVRDATGSLFSGLNLALTMGGTSLAPLIILFILLNGLVFPLLIAPDWQVSYQADSSYFAHATYPERAAAGAELFLAYGYTNFKASNPGTHTAIALYALLGIVWYALLIPVLLRRVYK